MILQQELFGPILPIFRFHAEEDAIQLANDTPYGLGASVWTGDKVQATRVASRLQTGMVTINGMVKYVIERPPKFHKVLIFNNLIRHI